MANNTDPGFGPGFDEQSNPGASTVGGNFDSRSTSPFGDADQRLYGGTLVDSTARDPAGAPSGPGYQGRHRAAD
jgi:hypothetical protein